MRCCVSRRNVVVGAPAALATLAWTRSTVRAAQISWRWSTSNAAEHPISVRSVQAFAKVRKETDGQFEIKAFTDSALGGDPAVLAQVRVGAVEMMTGAGSILQAVVPLTAIENVGFAFPNRQAAFAAQDGQLGALIRQGLAGVGLTALQHEFETGFRQVVNSKKPVHVANDLDGLKIRVPPGRLTIDTFKSLGAAPTGVPTPDTYSALQARLVDGVETALLIVASLKWYEVQKYCSMTNHAWGGHWSVINTDKWNSLPPKFRDSLSKNLNEAALLARHDNEIQNRSVQDILQRQGLVLQALTTAETFKAKLTAAGYYTRARTDFGDQAWNTMEKYTGALG